VQRGRQIREVEVDAGVFVAQRLHERGAARVVGLTPPPLEHLGARHRARQQRRVLIVENRRFAFQGIFVVDVGPVQDLRDAGRRQQRIVVAQRRLLARVTRGQIT
jgi:hypothetical protein